LTELQKEIEEALGPIFKRHDEEDVLRELIDQSETWIDRLSELEGEEANDVDDDNEDFDEDY
jgi:hypothetical protein